MTYQRCAHPFTFPPTHTSLTHTYFLPCSPGHLFHIDFSKFLGRSQMFGSFRRDRSPFVLTSDMAYVINGGCTPTSRFQDFVDLCCRAFNIIRHHTTLFLNLLSLMLNSGIPYLRQTNDLKYVYDVLLPQATDLEATTIFTRQIESSLASRYVDYQLAGIQRKIVMKLKKSKNLYRPSIVEHLRLISIKENALKF